MLAKPLTFQGQVYSTKNTGIEIRLARCRRGEDSEHDIWPLYICFTINFLTCHARCAKL